MPIRDLANPHRFLALARALVPAFAILAALLLGLGLVLVPGAGIALGTWALMAGSALGTLVWRHPLADVSAKAAAPIGAAFCLICLRPTAAGGGAAGGARGGGAWCGGGGVG